MGRIKTLLVKRIALKLVKIHAKEFTSSFEKNKEFVNRYTNVVSHKIRNTIAGYTARLVRQRTILENQPRRRAHDEDLSKFYE